ncbi:methylated-DNA--[protein]-cysteine S-methyltransferase [Gordonia sp. SID5947]|uniref:methylated-DNA--[protein]-cysteine S-methyltransferase n=1 Tax=Gordonia sp. SID5947 TaxID=2690315 RepID=UPI00136D7267|nr:methylated-DNA--[protein]-cysteine S-methyltransferase [Gordonia sp. SID5947]MYR07333.1 methylated-DNA--[protein]-cysteine S-methyltransferase [Gordonia sp. SID5947]
MGTRRHATIATVIGGLTLVADGDQVVGCHFPPTDTSTLGDPVAPGDDPLLGRAAQQVGEYLEGTRVSFDLPLRTEGDDFQERVWAALREIPFGTTVSYGDVATGLGDPALARRVGRAVGQNPIGVIIPCHRVIGADGSLTGFGGGLERKRQLLELEEPAEVREARLF